MRNFEQRNFIMSDASMERAGRNIGVGYLKDLKRFRPEIERFSDVFSDEEMKSDAGRVEEQKARFFKKLESLSAHERENENFRKARGEATEALFEHQADRYKWLGEKTFTMPTSEYDDYFNHADFTVEFDIGENSRKGGESERLVLAVDITFEEEQYNPAGKIGRNIKKILGENISYKKGGKVIEQRAHAPEIKYFESQDDDFRGRLEGVVPVIIGLEKENANELLRMSYGSISEEEKGGSTDPVVLDLTDKMQRHPAQIVFLEEIKIQLEVYETLLANGPKLGYTAEKMRRIHGFIDDEIRQKKQEFGIEIGGLENDEMLAAIRRFAEGRVESTSSN